MIDPDATVRKHERIAARVVEGKALVVVMDEKQLHRLNGVGTRVWELCDGRTVQAIADALTAEFRVDEETALADVRGFVDELVGLGALVLEDAA
ncbi:MAG: PqqD family protein [Myxococcales bacterium]|nr:PqqD family protein [Myxococcales bacterium]